MANWSDYQSAIQLVVGVNLGLYALPELRESRFAQEWRAETDLVSLANRMGRFAEAVEFTYSFQQFWSPITRQFAIARCGFLFMAAAATVLLLYASGANAQQPADGEFAWTAIIAGFLPTLHVAVLNVGSSHRLTEALSLRQAMQARLISPAAASDSEAIA